MSKKIAAGADAIVLDVKFGRGAFMAKADDARRLAETMRSIGARAGRKVSALLTNMDEPLADAAGDALELDQALSILEGRGGSAPLRTVAIEVAGAMLRASRSADVHDPEGQAAAALADGRALAKFRELAASQGGRLEAFDRSWPPGSEIKAAAPGRIGRVDARMVGEAVAEAKAGLEGPAAERCGVRLLHRGGDVVEKGQTVMLAWLPRPDRRLADAISIDALRRAAAP